MKRITVKKQYLGDSVYASVAADGQGVVLTTENGLPSDPSNEIVLELDVYSALENYMARAREGRL